MNEIVERLKTARRVGTPIVAITTPDPAATQTLIWQNFPNDKTPKIAWDVVRGMYGCNDEGLAALGELGEEVQETKQDPAGMLVLAARLPRRAIVLMHNAQRFIGDPVVMQAAWNLRDQYKADNRLLVLMGPAIELPPELTADVVEFDEPLPDEPRLQQIVREQLEAAGSQLEFEVTDELIATTAISLKGCSSFAAEQLAAMALRRDQLDREYLDTQARKMIEQTPGLTFERGREKFSDIGGLDFVKGFGDRLFSGPGRPAVVIRVEELEKTIAGAAGDLSGTSGDALQVILSEMEDNDWSGILAYGAPGAGKSLFAKSLANTHGAKAIRFDLNATKGELVGKSEKQIRAAMKVIRTIGDRRVFFVASINHLDRLPAELQRRFRAGVWFFDIPDAAQRQAIWEINRARFSIAADDPTPDEDDLTGADVRNICEMARGLRCSLAEARRYVVPLKTQSPGVIKEARQKANGRFLDASRGGVYDASGAGRKPAKRRVNLGGDE